MSGAPDPYANDPWLGAKAQRTRPAPRWLVIGLVGCGSLIALALVGLFVVGAALELGWIPQGEALRGKDVPAATLAWLREQELVEADEKVLYFCANGILRLREGGCFFTDRRVVSYAPREPAGLDVFAAPFGDVVLIESTFADGWFERSALRVETADMHEFELSVATAAGGDRAFDKELRDTWRAMRALAVPGLSADGTMKLERQLEILAGFGVALRPEIATSGLLRVRSRQEYEEQPFELLLQVLGRQGAIAAEQRASDDVWLVDYDCIEEPGDYARCAARVRELSDGALPIESISDEVDIDRGLAAVRFEIDGVSERWEAEVDEYWLDHSILTRFAALLARRGGGRRFLVWDDGVEIVLVCAPEDQLVDLRRQTGVTFELLE